MNRLAGALFGLALLAAPLAGEGQQAGKIWRIGYLDGSSPSARTTLVEAFKGAKPAKPGRTR